VDGSWVLVAHRAKRERLRDGGMLATTSFGNRDLDEGVVLSQGLRDSPLQASLGADQPMASGPIRLDAVKKRV
jgi:hypothetical protein